MAKATEEKKLPADEGPRSFARFIEQLDGGEAIQQLSADLQHLGVVCRREALNQNGKVKGKMTFTVQIEVEPRDSTVGVKYSTKVVEPARRTGGSNFWLTKGGNLTREAPKQLNLPVRVVDTDGVVRDVGADDAEAKEV